MPASRLRAVSASKVINKALRSRGPVHNDASKALKEASEALCAVEAKYKLRLLERVTLRKALADELVSRVQSYLTAAPSLPKVAPELWSDRVGRKENPVEFIRRVYAPWLGRGLMRSDLRALDNALYQALAVWMHRHPDEVLPELAAPLASIVSDDGSRAPRSAPYKAPGRSRPRPSFSLPRRSTK